MEGANRRLQVNQQLEPLVIEITMVLASPEVDELSHIELPLGSHVRISARGESTNRTTDRLRAAERNILLATRTRLLGRLPDGV